MLFLVHIHGNAAAVVLNGDGVVLFNGDAYLCAVAGKGFVYRVVYHFVYQMVHTSEVDVADIHCGTHSHRLQAFEHRDIIGTVILLFRDV